MSREQTLLDLGDDPKLYKLVSTLPERDVKFAMDLCRDTEDLSDVLFVSCVASLNEIPLDKRSPNHDRITHLLNMVGIVHAIKERSQSGV